MTRIGNLLAAALLAAVPSAGLAQSYFCNVQSSSGIVPTQYLLEYAGGQVTVTHGWIDGPRAQAVPARGSSARTRFSYSIGNVSGFGNVRATLAFRFTHNRSTGGFQVRINPVEYANSFSGSGSCQPE